MIQQSPLGVPPANEVKGAQHVIVNQLKVESKQQQCAACALLWWWTDANTNQSAQYKGHSSPDQLTCAEQDCTRQLNGVVPPLPGQYYSILYLYHVNGQGPCGRCISQLHLIANSNHPIRVYYGCTDQNDRQLPLYVSDFFQNDGRYDSIYQ